MPNNVEYIGFADMDAAVAHRVGAGGWIFATNSGQAIWFNLKFTPTAILTHHSVAGLSGKLI